MTVNDYLDKFWRYYLILEERFENSISHLTGGIGITSNPSIPDLILPIWNFQIFPLRKMPVNSPTYIGVEQNCQGNAYHSKSKRMPFS